ncbi:hypothetical protein Sjap_017585 [Stephania japonica]|uniref:Uncharacterized protein n=1 Tax=Stephania japonica TaxID=461633 RepID=A0AAP0NKJ7_9MAGN
MIRGITFFGIFARPLVRPLCDHARAKITIIFRRLDFYDSLRSEDQTERNFALIGPGSADLSGEEKMR